MFIILTLEENSVISHLSGQCSHFSSSNCNFVVSWQLNLLLKYCFNEGQNYLGLPDMHAWLHYVRNVLLSAELNSLNRMILYFSQYYSTLRAKLTILNAPDGDN